MIRDAPVCPLMANLILQTYTNYAEKCVYNDADGTAVIYVYANISSTLDNVVSFALHMKYDLFHQKVILTEFFFSTWASSRCL